MATIHPTAIVEAGAQLDDTVSIDAYAIVRKHVRIGAGTTVGPHTLIEGHTTIGRDNRIHQSCSIGTPPQDKKYAGEPTELEIGDRNTIREFCSIHLGTVQDEGTTWIGDDNWIMAYVHIAHDCRIGSQTIIASFAGLAGHVHLGDWAIVGGQSGLHQFVKFGAHAMCAFASHVSKDVPPYMMVDGNPLAVRGFNAEGLRRRGFSAERIAQVKQMHRLLYRKGLTLEQAKAEIAALKGQVADGDADVDLLLDFLAASARGIAR
jgi:UDP-N-acetylglucosamine acyltransferase